MCRTFLSRAVWGLGWAWEDYFCLTVSPVAFAGIDGCRLNAPVLLWHFSQFMLWDADITETWRKTTYGWEIHPNTHTHTRCHIWDFSRTLPQQVQGWLTQKSCRWFTHFAQQEFIGAKSCLYLHSALANICRPVMETVSVLPFGNFR